LNTALDYSAVFKGSKRSADDLFTVLARKNPNSKARLGLAIAKKSVKKAVGRNRIKRIVRESFRQYKGRLVEYDFVVMCRKKAGQVDKKVLASSIQSHLKKLAI